MSVNKTDYIMIGVKFGADVLSKLTEEELEELYDNKNVVSVSPMDSDSVIYGYVIHSVNGYEGDGFPLINILTVLENIENEVFKIEKDIPEILKKHYKEGEEGLFAFTRWS